MPKRPRVHVETDHNPDEVRGFYEIPDALAQMVRPEGESRTFAQCLADLLAVRPSTAGRPTVTVGGSRMKLDPPMLTEGPLSGNVYVVTHGKVKSHPTEDGKTMVIASVKYDVTDQFQALAARRANTDA